MDLANPKGIESRASFMKWFFEVLAWLNSLKMKIKKKRKMASENPGPMVMVRNPKTMYDSKLSLVNACAYREISAIKAKELVIWKAIMGWMPNLINREAISGGKGDQVRLRSA